jgi:hypothetical protein
MGGTHQFALIPTGYTGPSTADVGGYQVTLQGQARGLVEADRVAAGAIFRSLSRRSHTNA